MSKLADRPNTALLVIDMQNRVLSGAYEAAAVVGRIAGLVDRARQGGKPVVWVQHTDADLVEGSSDWQLVDGLHRQETEAGVGKEHADAFEGTSLEEHLSRLAVGHLVIVGAETDACIMASLHGAFVRGYDVTLVGDGHTTGDATHMGAPPPDKVIAHTNLYWGFHTAPGREARVLPANDVQFVAHR